METLHTYFSLADWIVLFGCLVGAIVLIMLGLQRKLDFKICSMIILLMFLPIHFIILDAKISRSLDYLAEKIMVVDTIHTVENQMMQRRVRDLTEQLLMSGNIL